MSFRYHEITLRHIKERTELIEQHRTLWLTVKERQKNELPLIDNKNPITRSQLLIRHSSELIKLTSTYLQKWGELEQMQMQELDALK